MILFCFGTRPEWLKIKPLIGLMGRSRYKLLFTGQHTDLLKDIEVDYSIEIRESSNRLDQLISDWHGQKSVDLPGEITLTRQKGKLWFTREKSLG